MLKRKIVLSLLGLAMTITGFAQFSLGVQAIGNLSSASYKDANVFDFKKPMKSLPGGGFVVQYAVSRSVAVQSGINYLKNGATLKTVVKVFDGTVDMDVRIDKNLDYVQVPLIVIYMLPAARIGFFTGGGGYVNHGVSGKSKIKLHYITPDGQENTIIQERKSFKKEEDGGAGFQRSDYGLTVIGGIRLAGGLFIYAGYQLGLSDISDIENVNYKNRSLQLTIGYFF